MIFRSWNKSFLTEKEIRGRNILFWTLLFMSLSLAVCIFIDGKPDGLKSLTWCLFQSAINLIVLYFAFYGGNRSLLLIRSGLLGYGLFFLIIMIAATGLVGFVFSKGIDRYGAFGFWQKILDDPVSFSMRGKDFVGFICWSYLVWVFFISKSVRAYLKRIRSGLTKGPDAVSS
jgi:hypothetical protein